MNPAAKEQKPYYDKHGKHYFGWFYDDVYGFTTHLIWPVSNKQRQAWFKNTYGIDDTHEWDANATCYELRHASGEGHAHLIALSKWEPSPKCIAMLTHECFHLVSQVFDQRGVHHDLRNEEPWAYLLESVVARSLRTLGVKP